MRSKIAKYGAIFLGAAIATMPFSMSLCHAGLILFLISSIVGASVPNCLTNLKRNRWVILYFVFLLLHVAGLLYTDDLGEGLFAVEKKIFFFVLPAVIILTNLYDRKTLEKFLLVFVGSCLVTTLWCLGYATYRYATHSGASFVFFTEGNDLIRYSGFWSNFSYTELASGIRIHPTYFALYLLFCLLVIVKLFNEKATQSVKVRGIYFVSIIYISLFIVMLCSKIVTMALMGVLLFIGFKTKTGRGRTLNFLYSAIMITSVILVIVVNPVARFRNVTEYKTISVEKPEGVQWQSINMRNSLWWIGIKSITIDNFLLGEGTGATKQVMKNTSDQYSIKNTLETYDPHNQFLFTMLSLGLVGLCTLLLTLFIPVVKAVKRKDWFYLLFAVSFLAVCLTESVLELQKGIVYYSVFHALLNNLSYSQKQVALLVTESF
jgi:hypothetical protein